MVPAEHLRNITITPYQIRIFVLTNIGLRAFLFSSLYSDTQNTMWMNED